MALFVTELFFSFAEKKERKKIDFLVKFCETG